MVLARDELRTLLDLARTRGWHVISDEAYEHFLYDSEHTSVASLERDLPPTERIVHSVFSFSKSFAMTGYRLGYVALADDRAADVMKVVQEANIIGTSTPVQYAGIAALNSRAESTAVNRKKVQHSRDVILSPLVEAGLLRELPMRRLVRDARRRTDRPRRRDVRAPAAGDQGRRGRAGRGLRHAARRGRPRPGPLPRLRPWARNLVRIAFCVDPAALETGVTRLLEFVDECGDGANAAAR